MIQKNKKKLNIGHSVFRNLNISHAFYLINLPAAKSSPFEIIGPLSTLIIGLSFSPSHYYFSFISYHRLFYIQWYWVALQRKVSQLEWTVKRCLVHLFWVPWRHEFWVEYITTICKGTLVFISLINSPLIWLWVDNWIIVFIFVFYIFFCYAISKWR